MSRRNHKRDIRRRRRLYRRRAKRLVAILGAVFISAYPATEPQLANRKGDAQ